MIIYVSRWEHTYTVRSVTKEGLVKLMSYDDLFAAKALPAAVYIFTDFDRLSQWELELASCVYQNLKAAGLRVLNNPAKVACRYELLRKLYLEGLNSFNVYRPSLGEWPTRYPVFVRRDCFHDGMLTDLLDSREALEAEVEVIRELGVPASNTIVVEFAAEPVEGDLYRKKAIYRIGDRYFVDTTVHERNWIVKYGEEGIASEDLYVAELEAMNTVPYEAEVRRAFELAGIEYGRVDVGLYDGKPQFYEINTNPTVGFSLKHPSPSRVLSRKAFVENYTAALKALDCDYSSTPKVKMSGRVLKRQRYKSRPRWMSWSRPTL